MSPPSPPATTPRGSHSRAPQNSASGNPAMSKAPVMPRTGCLRPREPPIPLPQPAAAPPARTRWRPSRRSPMPLPSYVQGTGNAADGLFKAPGAANPTAATGGGAASTNALAAITAVTNAVAQLGTVQGVVGAGENKLNYAVNLAQSQITSFSSAQSQIRDANVAAEAANLTKAQVLQQASIAAMAQANQEPQAVLSLLKG